jgi:hypothetical protein
MSKQNTDGRPRFGWTDSLDNEPQIIREKKFKGAFAVAVLPMPFMSARRRAVVREFQKTNHPARLFSK